MVGRVPDTVGVRVYPSRDAFTAALDQAWGIPETQCWMVGAGGAHALYLLAPDAWAEEACEHDPADREHVRQLVAHEAVHVLHSQVSPAEDLGLLEEIGWFTEGLATYVSGQLGSRHEGRAAEAIANGEAPAALADAWSGPYRYGVSGSMVAFIDAQWGRETLGRLLRATSQDEFLATLGSGETEFLDRWEGWVQQ